MRSNKSNIKKRKMKKIMNNQILNITGLRIRLQEKIFIDKRLNLIFKKSLIILKVKTLKDKNKLFQLIENHLPNNKLLLLLKEIM